MVEIIPKRYGLKDYDFRKSFAKRIKALRLENNLLMREVTSKMNEVYDMQMTASSLSNYERGLRMPDTYLLTKFASFFSVTTDYLLSKTDVKSAIVIESSFIDKDNITHSVKIGVTEDSELLKMSPLEIQNFIDNLKNKKVYST